MNGNLVYARLVAVTFLFLATAGLGAQVRPAWLDTPARVSYPVGYDPGRSYPILVWLPYTGGTAEEAYLLHRWDLPRDTYIVLLPSGRPLASDYLPAFTRFVEWYEAALLRDLGVLIASLRSPPSSVVVVGHSLGGDLGWALVLRNPRRFSGVVLSGTRASYPATNATLEALKAGAMRFHLFLGAKETRTRMVGLQRARRTLERAGLAVRLTEVPGLAHGLPPYADFVGAIGWASETDP